MNGWHSKGVYKGPCSQGYGFPVIMYGCESWTLKKAECRRIDAFELWCWRRLLRVPWTARRSNQSILKEISPGISLERMMLKLKLQYLATSCEVLTHWKRLWCWEGLGAGGEGDDRGWDGWMASLTRWTWVGVNSGSWWWTGRPGVLRFMVSQRVGHDWVTELNWTCMKCSLGISNFLEEMLVFPILLLSSISLHWSLRKTFLSLLAILWNSAFIWVYFLFFFGYCFSSFLGYL